MKPEDTHNVTASYIVPYYIKRELAKIAEKEDRPTSWVARIAFREYLVRQGKIKK